MFHKGATAVTASKSSGYFVAVKREGIFHYSLETGWKKLFHLKSKIHSITYIGPYLFGVGEKGTVIRSSDQGRSWTMSSFPTNATVWAITGQKDGFVCAHGKHCIYLSDDYGVSWQVAKPFSSFLHPPVIRSLCLHGDTLFIGTQIHNMHGGIWAYDFKREGIRMIKKEECCMTASMLVFNGKWLVSAMGSVKGKRGVVTVLNVQTHEEYMIHSGIIGSEESFLDVSEDDGIIYVTTTQDEDGYSRIYQVDLAAYELKWFDTIKGHGLRVANQKENFFCAGLYECKFVRPYEEPAITH
ncbi:exo-alpha-sialidase [Bacillus atrophaeus]|uniref:WD40/YVTN/BNR-like repeat-containing protein n=1 Tax=Bacillus atrophaeus TaxID=1452 RepID=UPI0022826560|nr:exo-alpha-sialidase [Bacillus atrophaeus]MCY8909956.1 exo-alpha-sialidase [Bacillus atrophaeus]MEC0836288.1 exo-alpha-sialidase [Bacillus atrophaeus]MEC0846662.1 exo-alpha-sialidase [Bacillus atrophaeus]MEC0847978.1 exo-alpha-sialidase [Bacillus atrophaeus]MEC0865943.1 exo-alpha-sialidase [Bacillus atrophaeus]